VSRQLLGEEIRQATHATIPHAHRQIVSCFAQAYPDKLRS